VVIGLAQSGQAGLVARLWLIRARRHYHLAMSLALTLLVTFKFEQAITHCDNLIQVHRRAGSAGPGGTRIEASVNRAVVVIAIASWQAVVQDMARFLLDRAMPKAGDPNYDCARLLKGQISGEIGGFATPNAENSRNLLRSVGFDPRPYWTWSTRDGGGPMASPSDTERDLRDWLKVRHAIAHGNKMPSVDVLQAVRRRDHYFPDAGPNVRLHDAKQCTGFIKKLTKVTLNGLDSEL
jgi:hypothetical protein